MTPNPPVSELGADLLTSALVEFMSTADERDSERLRAALHARGLTRSPANPEQVEADELRNLLREARPYINSRWSINKDLADRMDAALGGSPR